MSDDAIGVVREQVGAVLSGAGRLVLAVSGGIDSMTLLDAVSAVLPSRALTVATFDHGTGPAAAAAVTLVRAESAKRGLECVVERAATPLAGEAAFRAARWTFLREVSARRGATVCTGHTEDDQIETVLMRNLRDAGARGVAALDASSDVVRPLLRLRRPVIHAYAETRGLSWIDDPSNDSSQYLRNRVRHDLLPALRAVNPSIDDVLLAVARRAAAWRRDVATVCDALVDVRKIDRGQGLSVPVAAFGTSREEAARLFWPELAGRVGAVLDRRGMERLSRFTANSRVGARVQLSGGWEVVRGRNSFGLRHVSARKATAEVSALSDGTRFGDWTFRAEATAALSASSRDSWSAWLPADVPLLVRPWRAGDVMAVGRGGSRRKVKALLTAAGVTGHERAGWPVVVSGDDIVWIPGVRRIDAATARSGGPGLAFICEYQNR